MESKFEHKKIEEQIRTKWSQKDYFKAEIDPAKKPFTILLPPPNASGKMHTGNVLMIAIEDLLIRYKRMKGFSSLWVPGTDHAGFETQITFERELAKKGKSRLDYDRDTLYKMIWDFVMQNKGLIEGQITNMGASVDWSRYTFTLEDRVVKTVYDTFQKMHKDGLIYRGDYIVNYCPKCGTTFADLEIDFIERKDPLYYIRYYFVDDPEKFITVATCRPETVFADMWLAVNPKDKKKRQYVGQRVLNPLTRQPLTIIEDSFVDPKFGTGVVKITPAHDKNDYEVGLRQGLHTSEIPSSINWFGKLTDICVVVKADGTTQSFENVGIKNARTQIVEYLLQAGNIDKIDDSYTHMVSTCYKGGHDIEPVVIPNWFVKVADLKAPALQAVKEGKVKIYPKWREITYVRWMEEMRDWPISRQVVWGIKIPAWYKVDGHEEHIIVNWLDQENKLQQGTVGSFLRKGSTLAEIEKGLQRVFAMPVVDYVISVDRPKDGNYISETDTFDTWFSSGQWPLVTLGYPDSADYKYFYPTSVLETGWEIIRLWVSRMIMFGMYLTGGIPPFDTVYLHGMVRALDGKKMSKSLGNVINPDEYQEQYGTDALRMGLISGTANGKDFAFPKDKVIGYRNFANKLWNMGRFFLMMVDSYKTENAVEVQLDLAKIARKEFDAADKKILADLRGLIKKVEKDIEKYRFADAAEAIYQFAWHTVADAYIENIKLRDPKAKAVGLAVFCHVYLTCIKLLHPFMPFVTEAIWQEMPRTGDDLCDLSKCTWPK